MWPVGDRTESWRSSGRLGSKLYRMDISPIRNCAHWSHTSRLCPVRIRFKNLIAFHFKVNINPAYRPHELEYSLRKVGCKALIMSETFKNYNYIEMLKEVCPEMETSSQSQLDSKRLPMLKKLILIGKAKHKFVQRVQAFCQWPGFITPYLLTERCCRLMTWQKLEIQATQG